MKKQRILASFWVAAVAMLGAAQDTSAAAGLRLAVGGASFEVEPSAAAQASFRACTETLDALTTRGWDVSGMSVRIQRNAFDATQPGNALVIASDLAPEESAFELAVWTVQRQLRRTADPAIALLLAQAVAAHLAPPGAAPRVRWEREWLERLANGDLLNTALPELLWREGADTAMRGAANGTWPAAALAVLKELGLDRPLRSLGEVAVAGFLDPARLGFRGSSLPLQATNFAIAGATVAPGRAALRVVPLGRESDAVALSALHAQGVEAWVVVRYPLTRGYDAVPLPTQGEIAVPLRSIAWSGVIVVNLDADASLSLAIRPLPSELVHVRSWDFAAGSNAVDLAWQTEGRPGVQGYVVEALTKGEQGTWTVLRRGLLPSTEGSAAPTSYQFTDSDTSGVVAYRLLALTDDGFLAEIATFPLSRGR
jgi:hypothetical protein